MMGDRKRYQECNNIEKIWRCRWYLLLPVRYLYHLLISPLKIYETLIDDDKVINTNNYVKVDYKMLWSILLGDIDSKMGHYYTMEEVLTHLKKKLD